MRSASCNLPVGLFGVAIAAVTLPSISRSAGTGHMDEFARHLGAARWDRPAADHSLVGGAGGAGRKHDRHHLPGRPLHGLRYASDRAGAHLLQRRTGGLLGHQDAGERLFRARRCALSHAGEHHVDRHELCGVVQHGEVGGPRTRWAGALDGSGCDLRRDRIVGDVTAAHRRYRHCENWRPAPGKSPWPRSSWVSFAAFRAALYTPRWASRSYVAPVDVAISIPFGIAVFYGVAKILQG